MYQLPHRSNILHIVAVQIRFELKRNQVVGIQRFDFFLGFHTLGSQIPIGLQAISRA
ncbi:hypothetical protein D3C85_724030 [compost metagenome]